MKEVKLTNIKLLIRVADHDRIELLKDTKWERIKRDIKQKLRLLNKPWSRAVYDVSSISGLIKKVYIKNADN